MTSKPHGGQSGRFHIAFQKLYVLTPVQCLVPQRKLVNSSLLDLYPDKPVCTPFTRKVYRYDTTARAYVQKSFACFQTEEVGEQERVDGKAVPLLLLDEPYPVIAEYIQRLARPDRITHTYRARDR